MDSIYSRLNIVLLHCRSNSSKNVACSVHYLVSMLTSSGFFFNDLIVLEKTAVVCFSADANSLTLLSCFISNICYQCRNCRRVRNVERVV